MIDLIQEAKNRGYRKGTAIQYVDHATDYVEGDYFEIAANGDLKAYAKPREERKSFDDNRCDTLYNKSKDRWVKIV